jgi:hypothetical protein
VRDRYEAVALAFGGVPLEASAASGGRGLSLHAQATVVGAYQWVERRLFEVLGAWADSEAVPEAELLFDVYSQQHAWHAELLAERLPVLDSVDVDTLTVAPSAEVDRMLSVLAGAQRPPQGDHDSAGTLMGRGSGAAAAGGTLLRLVGVGRVVLPRLVAGYGLHLRRLSPAADAALGRCLRLVLRDELEQWQAVETLVQALLRRPNDIAVVTGHQQQLEQLIAETGAGLVPWPEAPGVGEPSGVVEAPGLVEAAGVSGAVGAVEASGVMEATGVVEAPGVAASAGAAPGMGTPGAPATGGAAGAEGPPGAAEGPHGPPARAEDPQGPPGPEIGA